MGKIYRVNGGAPKTYPYRVLDREIEVEPFTIEGNTVLPKPKTTLPEGTKIEVIQVQGKLTAIGLLNERRTSRDQQFLMARVSSAKLLMASSAL